jgi:hypothetical protein
MRIVHAMRRSSGRRAVVSAWHDGVRIGLAGGFALGLMFGMMI